MPIEANTYVPSLLDSDWTKSTLDLPPEALTGVDGLRIYLDSVAWSVEDFKLLPAYQLALASGDYPWLVDL